MVQPVVILRPPYQLCPLVCLHCNMLQGAIRCYKMLQDATRCYKPNKRKVLRVMRSRLEIRPESCGYAPASLETLLGLLAARRFCATNFALESCRGCRRGATFVGLTMGKYASANAPTALLCSLHGCHPLLPARDV